MAFGSNDFPLGPNGQFPAQRINSYGNDIAPPNRVEEIYELSGEAKLPVTEKDFHSSINRVKAGMKSGKLSKHSDEYEDIDRFRPKYAPASSLRNAGGSRWGQGNDEWLKRRKQRFPGLRYEKSPQFDTMIRPATGMSGVGFFGRKGNLGDVEQKDRQDYNQSLGYYTRKPYR